MSFCDKTAPVAKSLASVDNLKGSSLFGILRTGAMVKAFFSASKAFCCSTPQFQVQSFLVKSESGIRATRHKTPGESSAYITVCNYDTTHLQKNPQRLG